MIRSAKEDTKSSRNLNLLLQVDAPEEVDALPHCRIAPIAEVPKPRNPKAKTQNP